MLIKENYPESLWVTSAMASDVSPQFQFNHARAMPQSYRCIQHQCCPTARAWQSEGSWPFTAWRLSLSLGPCFGVKSLYLHGYAHEVLSNQLVLWNEQFKSIRRAERKKSSLFRFFLHILEIMSLCCFQNIF